MDGLGILAWISGLCGSGCLTRLLFLLNQLVLQSHLKARLGKDPFPTSFTRCLACFHSLSTVTPGPQFINDFWPEAVLNFSSHGSLHWLAHNMAVCFIRTSKEDDKKQRQRDRKQRKKEGNTEVIRR